MIQYRERNGEQTLLVKIKFQREKWLPTQSNGPNVTSEKSNAVTHARHNRIREKYRDNGRKWDTKYFLSGVRVSANKRLRTCNDRFRSKHGLSIAG